MSTQTSTVSPLFCCCDDIVSCFRFEGASKNHQGLAFLLLCLLFRCRSCADGALKRQSICFHSDAPTTRQGSTVELRPCGDQCKPHECFLSNPCTAVAIGKSGIELEGNIDVNIVWFPYEQGEEMHCTHVRQPAHPQTPRSPSPHPPPDSPTSNRADDVIVK